MAKIYDGTYTIEIFTEGGQRWVTCSHDGAVWVTKPFKTRKDLNKLIGDYIKDVDKQEDFIQKWGF